MKVTTVTVAAGAFAVANAQGAYVPTSSSATSVSTTVVVPPAYPTSVTTSSTEVIPPTYPTSTEVSTPIVSPLSSITSSVESSGWTSTAEVSPTTTAIVPPVSSVESSGWTSSPETTGWTSVGTTPSIPTGVPSTCTGGTTTLIWRSSTSVSTWGVTAPTTTPEPTSPSYTAGAAQNAGSLVFAAVAAVAAMLF